MSLYTIRELEKISGIKAHTIRIWEKRYGLISPDRTPTNIRKYTDSDLKKLLNVALLNKNGLKISKIASLSEEVINKHVNDLITESPECNNFSEGLTMAMMEMDEYVFEQLLSRAVMRYGFEDAVIKVVYPFLVKIGLMWQTCNITPVQEHFVSNLLRQKFFVALDGIITDINKPHKLALFFLPEGEMHELGLLFFCYLAKKRNHRVVYLGQSVPLDSI